MMGDDDCRLIELFFITSSLIHFLFGFCVLLQALLQTTSEILFKTTHRQTYFRQISILLPSHWANFNCTGNQEISGASYETNNLADFRMIPDHPVYNDKPWTLQYGPCGVPAKRISIPFSFVGGSSSNLGVRGEYYIISRMTNSGKSHQ